MGIYMVLTASRYRTAGVNIAAGDRASRKAMLMGARTHGAIVSHGAQLLDSAGNFASAMSMPKKKPVLLTAADGVGTKVELARANDKLEVIGRDVVAMCVNDILCAGGYPLSFLDYYACGKLNPKLSARVMSGITEACLESGCALVGGETAEMPGVYDGGKIDVAGFAIGIADKKDLFDANTIAAGDVILALPSNGAHSNGYSLINRILDKRKNKKRIAELLKPTRLYCNIVRELRSAVDVKALAHITGGGIVDNVARLMPGNTQAVVNARSFPRPSLFKFLQKEGDISEEEMWRTFNCGVGMAVFVAPENEGCALQELKKNGEAAWKLGTVRAPVSGAEKVIIKGI